jgi:small-conductance mechanosensitive channel
MRGISFMSNYLQELKPFADEVAAALIIIATALLLSRILKRLIDRMRNSKHLAPIMAGRLQTFRRWTILSLTVLILMQVVGVFGSAWALISAGLAAVAIGFVAVWSILSNATAAVLILTFRPFRLGDTIELVEPNGTGIGGCVEDINLMYTTLSVRSSQAGQVELPEYIYIPNNLFFQKILRTRSSHERGSKATFFDKADR